ncbi:MAG: DNA repair protein RadA, partial [Paenibacillaceae bacterium]|nr:DNA repair protein RadA [Paenibacillaceae bacterium]
GSFVLLGGDPGIGKSTLLLHMAEALIANGKRMLYVSGEESAGQIKMRADRIGCGALPLHVLCETGMEVIAAAVEDIAPDVLVIDSIQTVQQGTVGSGAGSVAQVRECTATLLALAKGRNMATVLIGHVTKEGTLAGPRTLEHMVDTVLSFEGERHQPTRLLRSIKNRFGATHELGMFEMHEHGLREVTQPSQLLLAQRVCGSAGSVVVASVEGTRPVLVEVQALVASTPFPSPRRTATGIDTNRLHMLVAVLEKRLGIALHTYDAYINVVGGMRLDEPAVDLAIAAALASSVRDVPTDADDVVFGEVGLTGEVRAVSRIEQRLQEAHKMGFRRVIMPTLRPSSTAAVPSGLRVVGVQTVEEAFVALGLR